MTEIDGRELFWRATAEGMAAAADAVIVRHLALAADAACEEEASLPRDVAELAAAVVAWRRVTGRETT